MDNLEIHADPSRMCPDGGRKPQQPEENPHKLEPASKQEGARPRFKHTSILLLGYSANCWASIPPSLEHL